MKHLCLIFLFFFTFDSFAQTYYGDLNHDKKVSIADVTKLVDVVLKDQDPEQIPIQVINNPNANFVKVVLKDGSTIKVHLEDITAISFDNVSLPDEPDVKAYYYSVQTMSSSNGYVYANKRMGFRITNNGEERVFVEKAEFMDGKEYKVRDSISPSKYIEPSESIEHIFNTGSGTMYLPICRFYCTYLGKPFTVEAQYHVPTY